MEIILSKNIGFCSGVLFAYKLSLKALEEEKEVYMLGELVHNKDVNRELAEKGLRVVKSVKEVPDGKTLILPAHGARKEDVELGKRKNLKLIHATCPFVERSLKIGRKVLKEGNSLFILGEKNHAEVRYLYSYLKNDRTFALDKEDGIPEVKGKVEVIIQSTMSENFYNLMKERIIKKNKFVTFHNTLCMESVKRQREVKKLSKKVDLLLVVGGLNSSNTKRLHEIGKMYTTAYHIETERDIRPEWFKGVKVVGIVSGTSTPMRIIEKVKKRCLELQ